MTSDLPADADATIDRHAEAILAVEDRMAALSRRLQVLVKNAATAIDPSLPPAGFRLLRIIERCGSVQSSVAADMLGVDRSMISRQVRQLEELGLVETRSDPVDGRVRFLTLTDEGTRRMLEVNPTSRTIMYPLLTRWSVDELESFSAQLVRLTESIDEDDGTDPQPER